MTNFKMVLMIEIEDRRIRKPFLGGWRHKTTGVEYLNAASQSGPPMSRMKRNGTCSRMVQSVEMRDANTQSPYHRATQMWRPDCNVSNETDKYLRIKPYETYEEMQLRLDIDGKARIIQRNYRIYRLLKYIKESARKYRELVENCDKYQEEKLILYRKRHQEETLRKIYPMLRSDFEMLYDLIEKWRSDCFAHTALRFFKAGRCAENYMILERTIEMFNVIEKKKQDIRDRYKRKKRVRFLTINCKPISWNGYKGKLVEMVTIKTQRARELKSIYDSLINYNVTIEERVEILIMLRKSLETHYCAPAFDLIRLLDREIIMLTRGVEDLHDDYFRERIIQSYLRFLRRSYNCGCLINDKEFCKNLESTKLREPVESRTKLCRSCWKLLPYYRFAVHGRMKKLSTCISCAWLRQRNFEHINYNPYTFLLDRIRDEERRKHSYSALAFMMQKHDIYHLVNNIWHGHSVVSKQNDLFILRLIRYDVEAEWSPWNCILLTEQEAELHYRIKDLTAVYSKQLLHQISLAHQIAKNHFKHLSIQEKDFRESSRYYKIQDRKDYRPALVMNDHYFS